MVASEAEETSTGEGDAAAPSDADLVRSAVAGSEAAFEVLVERHQRPLFGFAYRMLQDPDEADEVVQESFLQAYRGLRRFRAEASFKTWLYQIALNQCRTRRRRAGAHPEVSLDEIPEPAASPNGSAGERRATRAGLERMIGRLAPRQRSVLTLRVFQDLPFKEIGRVEGITENAAKVTYHYGIRRLRQWISDETD